MLRWCHQKMEPTQQEGSEADNRRTIISSANLPPSSYAAGNAAQQSITVQRSRISRDATGPTADQLQNSRSQEEQQLQASQQQQHSSQSSNHAEAAAVPRDLSERPTRPGAYSVTKNRPPGKTIHRVVVPANTPPGTLLRFVVEGRLIQVECPANYVDDQEVNVPVPMTAIYKFQPLKMAELTASPSTLSAFPSSLSATVSGGAFAMVPEIQRINEIAFQAGGRRRAPTM